MSLIHGKGSGGVLQPILALSGIVEEQADNTNLSAGTNVVPGTAVPADEIHVITHLAYYINSAVVNKVEVYADGLASVLMLDYQVTPTLAVWHTKEVNAYLQEGDIMTIKLYAAAAGDDVYFRYAGYKLGTPD